MTDETATDTPEAPVTPIDPGKRDVTPVPKGGKAAAKKAPAKAEAKKAPATKKAAPAKAAANRPARSDTEGSQVCKTCGVSKPMTSFPTVAPRKDGSTRGYECRACRDGRVEAAKAGTSAKAKATKATKAASKK